LAALQNAARIHQRHRCTFSPEIVTNCRELTTKVEETSAFVKTSQSLPPTSD
jgi:hypothetical protein